MSGPKVSVPCPHCGAFSTYQAASNDGGTGVQCKICQKSFRILMRNGVVEKVS